MSGLENGHVGAGGMAVGQEGHPRGARLTPSAPDDLWAAGRGVRHQAQNHPRSRKPPSRWKRPLPEKPGLEGDEHRMYLPGPSTARRRLRAPPPTSGPRHSTGAARGSGGAGGPSPEVLQSLGCPPQGEGCGHGEGLSCRRNLAPAFSPCGRVRRSGPAAATSLPSPALETSPHLPAWLRLPGGCSLRSYCEQGAGGQGPRGPRDRDSGCWDGQVASAPTAVPAPRTLAPGHLLTWNVPRAWP